ELARIIGNGPVLEKVLEQRKEMDILSLLEKLQKKVINYRLLIDDEYPEELKSLYDPPPVLYYKGDFSFIEPAVSIIGSRRCTAYGRKTAERLAYDLVQCGISIVSGMARGIDTHGHIGALKGKGKTIAVLGSGLDIIYPPENKDLFQEIQKSGVVISEYPPGVKPHPGNFPQRNRIISALSLGVVVVEAADRSGSLITADLALEQGREVFAVPGNIDRVTSRGCNNLIKRGAKLVSNIEDIMEELFLFKNKKRDNNFQQESKTNNEERNKSYPSLSEDERKIIDIVQEEIEIHINKIVEKSGFNISQVNTILLKLELKGLVSREAGKKYSFLGLQNLLKPL
ncbi:MAG TPA: DNA-processing protein DprA, partial [Halanaerobiales bacterium]|nr:DNA-processing protein DprA [Halanaerobiales bacterium]